MKMPAVSPLLSPERSAKAIVLGLNCSMGRAPTEATSSRRNSSARAAQASNVSPATRTMEPRVGIMVSSEAIDVAVEIVALSRPVARIIVAPLLPAEQPAPRRGLDPLRLLDPGLLLAPWTAAPRRLRRAERIAPWHQDRFAFARRHPGIGLFARHQLVLAIDRLTVAIAAEVFDEVSPFGAPLGRWGVALAGDQVAPRLGRRRAQHCLGRLVSPHRLDHWLKDRDRDARAGLAASERAALAVGIVVANPYRHGHIVGEAHEPGVILAIGGAGLAGDVGREIGDGARGTAGEHALQHGLELEERDPVGRADLDRRQFVPIDDNALPLDRVDRVRR